MNEQHISVKKLDEQSVVIQRAVSADAEVIFDVQRRTWLDTYPNIEAGISKEDIRQRIEGDNGERISKKIEKWKKIIETTDGTRVVLVARVGDKVIGFAAPGFIDGLRRIGALYVLPEVQGKGVGGKLIRRALEWHGTNQDIYLAVARYNQNAIDFYKRFDFEPTDRVIRDEGDVYGNKEIPSIEMVRRRWGRRRTGGISGGFP